MQADAATVHIAVVKLDIAIYLNCFNSDIKG